MRRATILSLVGIAALCGFAILGIYRVTALPPVEASPGSQPLVQQALASFYVPPPVSRNPAVIPARVVAQPAAAPGTFDPTDPFLPVAEEDQLVREEPIPGSTVELAVPFDLRRSAPDLEAAIVRRCGPVRIQTVKEESDPLPQGMAMLVLEVKVDRQELKPRILAGEVHTRGDVRDSLLTCAEWALRGHAVVTDDLGPGARVKVPLLVGMMPQRRG